jgi:hypothetical protein
VQDYRHRPVDSVAAEQVTDLVPDQVAQFLVVEQLQRPGVDHDERLGHADAHAVDRPVVLHVELG